LTTQPVSKASLRLDVRYVEGRKRLPRDLVAPRGLIEHNISAS